MLTIWLVGVALADVVVPERVVRVPVDTGALLKPGLLQPGVGRCVIDEARGCGRTATIELSSCETQADCDQGSCIVANPSPDEADPRCGCTSGWSAATGLALLAGLPWVSRRRTPR